MKKLFVAAFILLSVSSFAQRFDSWTVGSRAYSKVTLENIRKTYPEACRFYRSLDDYNNNKPVDNLSWQPGSWKSSDKIEVIRGGSAEKTKISDLSQYWITDEQGLIMRVDKDGMYFVVISGHFCYYIQYGWGYVYLKEDSTYSFGSNSDGKFFEFISEGHTGELTQMTDNVFEKKLIENGLYEAYKKEKPKREMRDSVNDYQSKLYNRMFKYFMLLNEKFKK